MSTKNPIHMPHQTCFNLKLMPKECVNPKIYSRPKWALMHTEYRQAGYVARIIQQHHSGPSPGCQFSPTAVADQGGQWIRFHQHTWAANDPWNRTRMAGLCTRQLVTAIILLTIYKK